MGKNIIVSEETIRDLLEAHASLSAWYYELWNALRAAGGTAHSPDDAARAAFVERLATDFPELGAVARSIKIPRTFVPPPPPHGSVGHPADEPATLIEPAPARVRSGASARPPEASASPAPPALVPPALVKPSDVKAE